MSIDIAYSMPVRKDICVVYCYYNPSGDPEVLKNTLALETKLKDANIPYFNAEVLYCGAKPVLESPTISVSVNSALFYKESVWNLLEKKVPSEFTKVCFMDVNLKYARNDWLDCLSLMLNFYDAIQPYNEVNYLDASGNIINTEVGAVKTSNADNVQGNIWGVTRNFFSKIGGFLDYSVIYSDLLFYVLNNPNEPMGVPFIDDVYKVYADKVKETGSKIRYLNCPIYSVPNGKEVDTTALDASLSKLTQGWNSMFKMNESGLWEVTDVKLGEAFKSLYSPVKPVAVSTVIPSVLPVAPVVVPVVAPVVAPVVVPVVAPVVKPVVAPVAKPVVAPVVKPVVVPVVAPVAKPVVAPVVVAPVVAPVVKPVARPVVAPVARPSTNSTMSAGNRNEAARAAAAALVASFKRK